MLPHVVAQDGEAAFHQRIVLIRRRGDFQLARGAFHQPDPAAAEAPNAGCLELLLEGVEAAERLVDRVRNLAGWLAAFARRHDLPKHRVIHVAAAVVAHDGADVLGHGAQVFHELLGAFALELGPFDGVVQLGDVGRVVLVVMDLHRFRVDVRLERVIGIWEWW